MRGVLSDRTRVRAHAGALATVALALALLSSVGLAACGQRTVTVKTGERVVCTYGEQVKSTVRTIEVPADEAKRYSVKTVTVLCPKHRALEDAYGAAQAAIVKQDFAKAKTELEKVVKVDPTYRSAKKQLDDISAGRKPAADPGTGNTGGSAPSTPPTQTTPGAKDPPAGPVASLLVYTPDTLAGYRAEQVVADVFAVSRVYLPTSAATVSSVVVAAEQHRSTEAAQEWLRDNVRAHYTQSARNVRVGNRDGYTGTDGSRFAVIAWTEGPITVVLEADARTKPAEALAELQKLAAQIVR